MDNTDRQGFLVKDEIFEKLSALSAALQKRGKVGPADFFDSVGKKIKNAADTEELKEVLRIDIEKSGAIVQYGDFSPEEERIFSEVHDLALAAIGGR